MKTNVLDNYINRALNITDFESIKDIKSKIYQLFTDNFYQRNLINKIGNKNMQIIFNKSPNQTQNLNTGGT